MPFIHRDPVGWAASAVGTLPRLIFMYVLLLAIAGVALLDDEMHMARGLLLLLVFNNMLCCYAMWRMYSLLKRRGSSDSEQPPVS